MVNEEIVKKQSDSCLCVEGWSADFEVVEYETEWCDTRKKKCHSLRATVTTRNRYVQINIGIPEKVITETLGHKSSRLCNVHTCNERTSSVQQQSSNCFCQQYCFRSC